VLFCFSCFGCLLFLVATYSHGAVARHYDSAPGAPSFCDRILDALRRECESCDRVDSFLVTAGAAGGAGSGLTAYMLREINEELARPVLLFALLPSPAELQPVALLNTVLFAPSMLECVASVTNLILFLMRCGQIH
jgi:hypothetical protein